MFLQDLSQWIRRKVQRVSIAHEDLRARFLQYILGHLPESRTNPLWKNNSWQTRTSSDAAAACEQELYRRLRLTPPERRGDQSSRPLERSLATSGRAHRNRASALAGNARPQQREKAVELCPGRGRMSRRCRFILYLLNTKMHPATQKPTPLTETNVLPQTTPPVAANPGPAPGTNGRSSNRRRTPTRRTKAPTTYQVHRESPIQLQILLPGETALSGYQVRVARIADQGKVMMQQKDLRSPVHRWPALPHGHTTTRIAAPRDVHHICHPPGRKRSFQLFTLKWGKRIERICSLRFILPLLFKTPCQAQAGCIG